ncbi:MAG: UDP-N-acetylmuramoyl-L-alanyl-D-glutamate--2,6-diaminopimelate ligase [Candidatus Binatia bacterium]|nr:UDP-N-acetylmuramoyl-L-alanyl-D-glutamate--2,6-diaminopimelate ligase [Candidatus Binatia bacterium]
MSSAVESTSTVADLVAAAGDARIVHGEPTAPIGSVRIDSRQVTPGDLFVAIRGEEQDGARFVGAALTSGAHAIAVEEDQAERVAETARDAVVIACSSSRRFAAAAAAERAGRPSTKLVLVAITGTSGKTTTAWILEKIFQAAGHPTGLIGTIEYRFADECEAAPLTTPDAVALQDLLRRMVDSGVTHAVMEASSHALALDRLHATSCDAGVYTNLSRDHLDFHEDLSSYAAAKARLLHEVLPDSGKESFAVLNAADAEGRRLAAEITVPHVSFGEGGDVSAEDVECDLDGLRGTLVLGDERAAFATGLIGTPHLQNLLAASAAAWRIGIPAGDIVRGLADCASVPGRLEMVRAGQPFAVIVDYAHKPDALEHTLGSLRTLTRERLIVVFGCGGDRDVGKRKIMGEIAGRLADLVILTSDNPRTEDPLEIIKAIETGVQETSCTHVAQEALGQRGGVEYAVVPGRRAAIQRSMNVARAGDLVLIAGKGHEDYQIVGTTKSHFDDREEIRRALGVAA